MGADDGATPPADPMTVLSEGAVQAHELYVSFVAAGFSEGQALYLLGRVLTASANGSPPDA